MRSLRIVIAASMLTACGAKRPMETLPKFDNQAVSTVKTDSDFLYLISVSDSDSTSSSSRPHWMSNAKTIRYKFTKTSLDLIQTVVDPRLQNNPTNEKPILSIPVSYFNYKCRENDFKECTNKEEVDDTVPWNKKQYFVPDYEKLEISELSFLPLALDEVVEGCFTKTGQKLVNAQLDENNLNIELERTYKAKNANCLDGVMAGTIQEYLDNLVFKVRYHISVAKASTLTDSKYPEVLYPEKDQSTFGFFTTQEAKLDIDNRPTVDKVITKLNRWSPNKKEIVYNLSDAFELPEYKAIKSATFDVAKAVNDGLQKAGAGIHFSVRSASQPGMSGEDLRNSTIILVPEAMDSGLLGYGPAAVNPKTGEIVHARVVMYLGNMKEFIYRTWDEVIDEQVQKKKSAGKSEKNKDGGTQAVSDAKEKVSFAPELMSLTNGSDIKLKSSQALKSVKNIGSVATSISSLTDLRSLVKSQATSKRSIIDLGTEKDSAEETDLDKNISKYESLMEYYTKNNYYPSDLYSFENAIMSSFKGQIPDRLLKSWAQLTDVERQEIIDLVLPITWTTTLIHEIGHTLGLRHNFNGSEDKENFYSEEELKAMGIDHPINISSVMEYPYEDIGALPVMGKYDIAALRFGYARKAELADKSLMDIDANGLAATATKKNSKIKKYGYCTDEHVDVNPGCKQFDTGTTLTEIAQHEINIYEKYYKYRNFRNGRRFFNTSGDAGYASRTSSTFRYMRLFLDRYQDVQKMIPDVKSWDTDAVDPESRTFLKDLKQAVTLIGNHFLDILVEPDVTCVYQDKETSKYGIIPLAYLTDSTSNKVYKQFNPNLYSCMRDLKENDKVSFVGQIGRYFNSKKDPEMGNPYVDEIDTRGIMLDKLLASHYLLTRNIGTNKAGENSGNYMDVPEIRDRLLKMYFGLLLDEVPVKISAPLSNGDTLEFQGPISLSITHVLKPTGSARVNRLLGIYRGTPFNEMLLRDIGNYTANTNDREQSLETLRLFQVSRNLADVDLKNRTYATITTVQGNNYYIFPENIFASIAFSRWQMAKQIENAPDAVIQKISDLISKKAAADQVAKDLAATVKELKIADAKESDAALAKAQETYAFFAKFPDAGNRLSFIMGGNLKSTIFYEDLIAALPDPRYGRAQEIKQNK